MAGQGRQDYAAVMCLLCVPRYCQVQHGVAGSGIWSLATATYIMEWLSGSGIWSRSCQQRSSGVVLVHCFGAQQSAMFCTFSGHRWDQRWQQMYATNSFYLLRVVGHES